MPDKSDYIKRAQQALADLTASLEALPGTPLVAEAVVEARYLARAIDAFHLEAIRFRIHALNRRLHDPACPVDDSLRRAILDIRAELERAGFQTRSVVT